MTLPKSLARWRHELAIFPDDIASSVGHMLPALTALLGNDAHSDEHDGEPDGFDGVARRGPYERLVPSEWGVQQVSPLEFLRRAAENEHSFFQLSRVEAAPQRGTVVLFDSGPEQLGACRIVQLALLVLLHQRAKSRGARFGWQCLVNLGESLYSNFDEPAVQAFLRSRTALSTNEASLSSWEWRLAGNEVWVIGDTRLVKARARATRAIALTERERPDTTRVDVTLEGARLRRVSLELPAPDVATRLLRNPFDVPRKSAVIGVQRPHDGFFMNPQGSRLFFRARDGRVAWMPLQSAPHTPRFVDAAPAMKTVAIGSSHRRTNWLSIHPGLIALQSTRALRGLTTWTIPGPLLEPHATLWPLELSLSPLSAALVAGDNSLWQLLFETQRCSCVASSVIALCSLSPGSVAAAVARTVENTPGIVIVSPNSVRNVRFRNATGVVALRSLDARELLIGHRIGSAIHIERLVLAGGDAERPALVLHPPSGTTLCGLDFTRNYAELGILVLDGDRRALSVVGRSHSRQILKTRAEITHITVASRSGRIAYATENGHVGWLDRDGSRHVIVEFGAQ